MEIEKKALRIHVGGIVQGVGFRPFIFTLAEKNHLTGWVKNTSSGVEIEVVGDEGALQGFLVSLRQDAPPLARIDQVRVDPIPVREYLSFSILSSLPQPGEFLPVSPDVGICPDCRRELFDPSDRRYRYPFINCTHCGPRFTIIRDIPYDRPNTTMASFIMCGACRQEYEDPRNRRFHAQPIACPDCGPRVYFIEKDGQHAEGEQAIQAARKWLVDGRIVAIKGLGGFHLACDATNPKAVEILRSRKKRSDKPFALMAFDLVQVENHCLLTPVEREVLTSREKPIVLARIRTGSRLALEQIAPNLSEIGVMLAYTPLHLLLLEPEAGFPEMLVMTSGNLSEEPIAFDDEDAMHRLRELADAFLVHDRSIQTRVDDSVVSVFREQVYPIRRARGYAPDPVILPFNLPSTLAVGAELKNAFCLTRSRYAFLSHHIGDMENLETYTSFETGVEHYERLFRIKPELIACDLHPNYLATRYAQDRASREKLPIVAVQHHHAHLASCLADHAWDNQGQVIGVIFDGTGYGADGAIWGGEFFYGGYASYQRKFHLDYVPLPGGDLAVRKPARMALSYLWKYGLEWEMNFPPAGALCEEERTILRLQLERAINAPLTSSMGRLFDAVSAFMGIRQVATYEGQAAIEMEALVDSNEKGSYPFDLSDGKIIPLSMWEQLITDWHHGVPIPTMAARFHNGVAEMIERVCRWISGEVGCKTVALSGGVWQNRFLLGKTVNLLENKGFDVLVHRRVPANDGGIALGQAMVAATQMKLTHTEEVSDVFRNPGKDY
ncbi:hydrogenase maturation protein, carbamoyltransferase HypF [Anaerolinea thermolimosa]|uniref:carbamoyltransferase HypF n=1 Tax=Anaerolinea thermolimosa TaxID=229919 RepID=UPI0007802587|nr:carbamoyltransferase HypF [Anaerolinea thermolimosa]GAP06558.1 hydrogenase maturation protein, carbamoyltransferase HypF [Anaerolinea thermolimosa]